MPDQTVPVTYPNTEATTIKPITPELSPAISQTTHPSTTSHDPGELGRAAISEAPKPDAEAEPASQEGE